MIRDNIW